MQVDICSTCRAGEGCLFPKGTRQALPAAQILERTCFLSPLRPWRWPLGQSPVKSNDSLSLTQAPQGSGGVWESLTGLGACPPPPEGNKRRRRRERGSASIFLQGGPGRPAHARGAEHPSGPTADGHFLGSARHPSRPTPQVGGVRTPCPGPRGQEGNLRARSGACVPACVAQACVGTRRP